MKKDKPEKESPKKLINTSINLAVNRLHKEENRPHALLDKMKREKPTVKKIKPQINSVVTLKKSCTRLMNYLHQHMHHTVAIRVSDLTKLIVDKMPKRDIQKITDILDDISNKHGYDFFKP